ncbi:probable 2-oxoglutarate-dependent dioxygenase AOP1 isoform X1 [Cajanus cajan]|uniref:Gibberellin 2-beta-dioxygenase 7 n=1 Tax=Cajanus cajan TaxID=3821 RepID=A0A151RZJ9_CAJCA|nr:probable 2-oxoglutarate-dependent dioxygenase AOP1 isoform X1 [Cajanus cajan]KYP47995.1 Gibberellin 2-beta-dioxygenase 7 [Cajanus cajan]
MGSETEASLPVIDFSIEDLESNVAEWELVKSQVHKALVEYGCFEAVFDKVPLDLRKAIFLEVEEMFDLPLQTKQRVVSSRPYHGYVGPVQIYESMGIEDADVHDKVESLIKILWPQGKPSFSKNLQFFIEQVSRLDQIIRKMILESLGVEKYLEEHMNSTNYLARLIKYEGPQTNEAKFGLVEHTDKNIFTTLCQNQIDGLEVQTKCGEWIKCKPSTSNSFVVLTGDTLYAWTNGRVHTPVHRVMMSGNETRFSIGLFTVPKPGLIIKAPDELVTEEHPLLFKPFVQSEFMKFLRSSEGIKNALKVYCGV